MRKWYLFGLLAWIIGAGLFVTNSFAQSNEADALWSQCGGKQTPAKKRACYQKGLGEILRKHGTEQALTALEELTSQDLDVLRNAHPYTHHLGRASFTYYQDVAEAFAHCRETFWSGCYHGVLEGYLRSLREVESENIANVCSTIIDTWQSTFLRYQCLHGLGHGLALYFNHNIHKALAACDALASPWERESCYSGIFMENIVAYLHPHHTHHAPQDRHQAQHESPKSLLRPEDPLYPCNAIDHRYQRACYRMQSSAIVAFTQYDFAQAFQECEKAPAEFVPVCYQSLGRDVSGYTLRDPTKTIALCRKGSSDNATQCFVGAVKDFILTQADPQRGLALCRRLDEGSKEACYAATGEVLLSLYPDRKKRAQSCAQAEDAYIAACQAAASAS